MRVAIVGAVASLVIGFNAGGAATAGPLASITKDGATVQLNPIVSGLDFPTDLQFEPTGGRAFVSTLSGQVRLIKNGALEATPVLDLTSVTLPDPYGMTSIALDPHFSDALHADFGKFYVLTCEAGNAATPDYNYGTNHQGVLYEYRMSTLNPDVADTSTKREILRVGYPDYGDHHMNDLAFGPDGKLYLSAGDGGNSGNNPNGNSLNAQDLSKTLGKVLRIDPHGSNSANGQYGIPVDNPFVSTAGARGEIYAYGFRNPYRISFDRQTGDMWEGDVGQLNIEEINKVVSGGNYGWRYKEGTYAYNASDQSISSDLSGLPAGLIDPVGQYDHDDGSCVITGFIYRGAMMPDLQGELIFGDWAAWSYNGGKGRLWHMNPADGIVHELTLGPVDSALTFKILGFGEDSAGELYVLSQEGSVYAIVPEPSSLAVISAMAMGLLGRRRHRVLQRAESSSPAIA